MGKKVILETTIPFSGFYNSVHEDALDRAIDQAFSDDSGTPYQSLVNKAHDCAEWGLIFHTYAVEYAKNFGVRFGLKSLKFCELNSPREYNFTTDRIFCKISLAEVKRIFRAVDKDNLRREITKRFTSRDGFISFYLNDLAAWPSDLTKWDPNHVGTLLRAYTEQETGEELRGYHEMDEVCGDFWDDTCGTIISDNLKDADRLYKISHYLRSREERVYGRERNSSL